MCKTTIYREKLLYYIDREEEYDTMLEWIEEQPELDQPDILRELKSLFKERYDKTGEQDCLEKTNLLEEMVDDFEESILDEKLSVALFIAAVEKMDINIEKIEFFLTTVKESLIKSIHSDSENNQELRDLAKKTIKAEKESGLYDPANWSAIF